MKIYQILKATLLLIISLAVIIPMWINYFDGGEEIIRIEDLLSNNKKLSSLNLKISGQLLFANSCKFNDYDNDGKLSSVF